jgi:hypothetical protein
VDDAFAISGNGLAGTLVRPSALIIAIAGGMIVPGAQVEAGMQPEAIQGAGFQGAGVTTGLAPSTHLTDMRPDPDVLTLADIMGPRAKPAVDVSGSGLMYVPAPSPSVADRQLGEEVSGSLKITATKAESLSFGRAVDGVADRATVTRQFADAFPVDVFTGGPGDSDAGLVAPPAPPALSAGELSGNASTSAFELVAFDPFATKSQPAAGIAENLAPPVAAHADGIEFVSSPVVQPIPEHEWTAKPAIPAILTKSGLALHDQRPSASPQPLAAAPSKAAMPASALTAPKTKTIQTAPARSYLPAAMVTPRPLSTPKVVSGRTMPGYRLSGDVIEFAMATRINGQPAVPIPLRVTKDDRLWLRTGDLLSLVKKMMPQDQYDRLAASSAMEDYVTFDKVRSAGISLRYDVARNLIAIGNY